MDAPIINEVRDLVKGRLTRTPTIQDQWDLEKIAQVPDIDNAVKPQLMINPKAKNPPAENLSIASWNIAYGDEFDDIVSGIKYFENNIMKLSAIALQEVDQNSPISGYRDVCFELAEALGFSAVYSSELVYLDHKRNPLVNDGRPCAKGNAILTRLPLKKELEMLRLTPQYDFYNHRTSFDITQNNHWGNRTALITELDYGKGIRFISTHLEDKTSSYRRGKQALDIIEKNLKDKAEEVFVCGDFNTFWSVLERTDRLFKLAGYERTIKLASTINMKLPLRLDNIYAKTHKKLANSGVYPQSNGSDHKMVYAQYI